jgi:CRISPR/Cas system-associated exonuclease Cas4 (RecB family)
MRLVTIHDLETNPPDVTKELVARAMRISTWYDQWKEQDPGGYSYTVEVSAGHKRSAGIHASEISNCPRRVFYTMTSTEQRREGRNVNMQRRFNMGHAVHAMVQQELRLMGQWLSTEDQKVTFEDEVPINPNLQQTAKDWDLYSSCDGVLAFHYQGNPYLRIGVEIKTKSGPEYEKLSAPEPAHLEQTCMYMAALDLPLMWLLYYNKSNSNYTSTEPPWLFKFDRSLWNKLTHRFHDFHVSRNSNALPLKAEGFYCGWCPYSWTCKPQSLLSQKQGGATIAHSPRSLKIPGR